MDETSQPHHLPPIPNEPTLSARLGVRMIRAICVEETGGIDGAIDGAMIETMIGLCALRELLNGILAAAQAAVDAGPALAAIRAFSSEERELSEMEMRGMAGAAVDTLNRALGSVDPGEIRLLSHLVRVTRGAHGAEEQLEEALSAYAAMDADRRRMMAVLGE